MGIKSIADEEAKRWGRWYISRRCASGFSPESSLKKLMEGVPMSANFHSQIPRGVELEAFAEDLERMNKIELVLLYDLPQHDFGLYIIAIYRYIGQASIVKTAKEMRRPRESISRMVHKALIPWVEKRLGGVK